MKIAVNCAFYQPRGGGIKEYVFNLVNNLAELDNENIYILYVLRDHIGYARRGLPERFRIKVMPFNSSSAFNTICRSLLEQYYWKKEEQIEKWDIFHSPFFHSPQLRHAKTILTVHDLRFFRFPKTYTFKRWIFLKYKVRKSILNADHIISISNFTKNEIIDAYKIDGNKVTVIHEAINLERYTAPQNVDGVTIPQELRKSPFLLSVGHLEPRKNYDRLIEAFMRLKETSSFESLRLVIVGKKGHSYENTLKLVASRDDILYLNFVDHSTLMWLYQNTVLFVFPSYYEGFGFPPLEAGALGAVSAVSNVSSMPEVCGNATQYFDPYCVDDIASAIVSLLNNPVRCRELRELMAHRISEFSWEENARQTLAVYGKVSNSEIFGGGKSSVTQWLLAA